ncbi:aryl hydrocarbon receptor-like [Notolabrus celidotus]|uniref:aryl hydrocarbon receptor-like n=1 Tax=Notolabrus celidotus TaxID=1203425 RepID=UPI00148F4AB2|nr:aryl hydrocarbon receptor-like [Notolabrus celidotus]XP_034565320.1 aryl hydrocarbon receptor-like [Notolabrus celidotus]
MPGNSGVYAVKRRKKPVQKVPKPPPVKTNPSKRHRDRLNVELERLTGMLPFSEEVKNRLDKLSVLRLSVGYLKAKSYFHAALQKRSAPPVAPNGRNGQSLSLDGVGFSEGDLLLQALNGFVLVVTTDGTIFYASPTIQDFLGFHQSDVVHQSVGDLVHVDDREMFKCQLHFALNPGQTDSIQRAEDGQSSSSVGLLPQYIPPENSSFLERSFCCRLRCLLDNTSGFLALNFHGHLKFVYLQGMEADGTAPPPQLALFAIATPVQPPSVMEIRTKTLIFQSKHRMDFAPMGIDTRGKLVLGYSETELVTTGSGYQFIHAADMMYCADNHLRMIKTGDSGFTFFRLLTKTGQWLWVQANARVVFKGGRPDFIIARQKALTNEEGEEHLHQRRQQLPFNLATGEGVLYDTSLDAFSMSGPPESGAPGTTEPTAEKPLDPASLLGSLRRQDHSVYTQPQNPSPPLPIFDQIEDSEYEQPSFEQAFLDSHALLSVPGQIQASQKRSITGDLTSDAMIDSLEQILGDIGDGMIQGLEVEETELRDWENTLVDVNNKREEASMDINSILANDVFSYVEEALRREAAGFVQIPDQKAPVSVNTLSNQGPLPGSVFSNNEFADQTLLGDVLVGCSGPKGALQIGSNRAAPTQCRNNPQEHTSSLWPPSGDNQQCGNPMISTQSFHAVQSQPHVAQESWLPSVQNNIHQSGSGVMDQRVQYRLNHAGPQQTYVGQPLQTPSAWQQQQLPPHFPHHTLTHSSHTPGSVNSTAPSFHPQTQRLSGSCMYEKREGHIPNAAARQNGPPLGPPRSKGPTHGAGTTANPSHPNGGVGVLNQGMVQSNTSMNACAEVGNLGFGHRREGDAVLGPSQSEYPNGNASLQSSFFCWNGEAQISNGTLNGVDDSFAFPPLPSGNINLSQSSGSQPPLRCPQRL